MNSNNNVLLTEKYTDKEKILFVKLHDQSNVMVVIDEKPRAIWKGWWLFLLELFLPRGYPGSVSSDYTAYQLWDTAQAFCSTIMGTLATHQVLTGVGVGRLSATPIAATITWVLKDGCGHVARIIFAYCYGSHLDAYSKKWRLYADILNDLAMCVEVALPFFNTTLALCASSILKAVVGVAGAATRIAMTRHHALRANMADVAAKDAAQETAVNLVASLTAIIIIYYFKFSFLIFFIMMIMHITFNYMAVSSVCLKTLNEPRYLLVINNYLELQTVGSPKEINKLEPILPPHGLNSSDFCSYQIKMGKTLRNLTALYTSTYELENIKEIYDDTKYILIPDTSNLIMYVFLKESATGEDILRGYFHAVILATVMESIIDQNKMGRRMSACKLPLVREASLQVRQEYRGKTASYKPTVGFLKTFLLTVTREWEMYLKPLLQNSGWDLNKHVLMLDEWRITEEIPTTPEPKVPSRRRLSSYLD